MSEGVCIIDLSHAPVLRELLEQGPPTDWSAEKKLRSVRTLKQRRDRMRHKFQLDYCWMILMRLTRIYGFIPRHRLRKYAARLANKHANNPMRTKRGLLQSMWLARGFLGMYKGKPIVDTVQLAHEQMHQDTPFCWLSRNKNECLICGERTFDDGVLHLDPTCRSEWCLRLYTFYYVEGRSRPSTVRGLENKELRFNYLLSNYVRRFAIENQSGSKHRRAA